MLELFAQLLLTGVVAGGSYALLAVGYTLVYGVLGFINFAHGDVAMIGAYVTLLLSTAVGLPLPVAIVAAMAVAALLGVGIERVAYRPLRRAHRLAPLISAIAVSLALESVALLLWGADIRTFRLPVTAGWQLGPFFVTSVQLVILGTALAAMIALQLLLRRTALGKAIRATADNLPVAAIVGIDVNRVIAAVFALGSALAALAATLLALEANLHPTVGILMGVTSSRRSPSAPASPASAGACMPTTSRSSTPRRSPSGPPSSSCSWSCSAASGTTPAASRPRSGCWRRASPSASPGSRRRSARPSSSSSSACSSWSS